MASNTDALKEFFVRTINGLEKDAAAKGQKTPINQLRFEVDEISGTLYAPDYFKYLIYGRGPGKFPPPEKMTDFVDSNPEILDRARQVLRKITAQQLGFLIGRKIAREGTDIFSGKRLGIDLLGVMEEGTPDLLKALARNEVIKIATDLRSAVKIPVKV